MLAREPIPPPPKSSAPRQGSGRTLYTSLQLPREARWSRPSAVVLSVLVHVALFIVLRHYFWKPTEQAGPAFQILVLSQPKEDIKPLDAPTIPPPIPVLKPQPEVAQAETRPRPTPSENATAPTPALVEPTFVPSTLPPPSSAVATPSVTTIPGPAGPRTAAQRLLQSGGVTTGSYVTQGPLAPMPTPQQAAAERLATGIRAINDSMAAAAAAANSATDWTKKDKNGNRWGVSPGQLHLGSITLPLPFYFAPPPGRRADAARDAKIFAESNAQAKRMEMEETFESRVKAMRKRKDAERDSAKAARTGH